MLLDLRVESGQTRLKGGIDRLSPGLMAAFFVSASMTTNRPPDGGTLSTLRSLGSVALRGTELRPA